MNKKQIAVALSVLKEMKKGEHPCSTNYGILPEEFIVIVTEMANKKLLSNFTVMDMSKGDDPMLLRQARVTLDGEVFLSENSKSMKVYHEIKDWVSIVSSMK